MSLADVARTPIVSRAVTRSIGVSGLSVVGGSKGIQGSAALGPVTVGVTVSRSGKVTPTIGFKWKF